MLERIRKRSSAIHREAPGRYALSEMEVPLVKPEKPPERNTCGWTPILVRPFPVWQAAAFALRRPSKVDAGPAAWQNGALKCRPQDPWTPRRSKQPFQRPGRIANHTRLLLLSMPGVFPNLASPFGARMTPRRTGD